jgi:two-component system nitrate/nitrite response regulator NarL
MASAPEISVAILEDHYLMRESLSSVLDRSGFSVLAKTGDPEAFLASVAEHQPEVAIIDLTLESDMGVSPVDGIAVLKEMREYHPDIKTLVLSASRDPETVARCYQEGAGGYLYKLTASSESVLAAVQAVAYGKRLFPFQFLEESLKRGESHVPAPNLLGRLTIREREVLGHVASGADNLKIASLLKITERTVKAHISSLYRKLGPENRVELALLARHFGVRATSER